MSRNELCIPRTNRIRPTIGAKDIRQRNCQEYHTNHYHTHFTYAQKQTDNHKTQLFSKKHQGKSKKVNHVLPAQSSERD